MQHTVLLMDVQKLDLYMGVLRTGTVALTSNLQRLRDMLGSLFLFKTLL